MKVLVTGAGGFLGQAVVRHLVNAGYSVRAMVRHAKERFLLKEGNIEIVKGDVIYPKETEKAVDGCNTILHLASVYAFYPWWDKEAPAIYKINVDGTRNMLNAALKHKVEKFIFTSSVASIGKRFDGKLSNEETVYNLWKNSSHYARSKLLAEQEVLKYCQRGLPALILNPAIIIGEGDYKPTPSGEIIVKFLNKQYLFCFNAVLSVADVDDVAEAHISAIKKGRIGERYILCNKDAYSMEKFFALLEKVSGVKAPKAMIPYPLLLAFVYLEETLSYLIFKKKPLMPSEGIKFCNASVKFDNSKAVKELGYTTIPFKETLTKAVNWYRENGYVKNA
ncbi:MAG: NAD-dependent epimerase/dehydratase family protein [Candidatus Omnitrophota bacterium]|nr:NAD-dependent epimerase/dehydratase family protein [Candidatus Omnitrophota bacterium]